MEIADWLAGLGLGQYAQAFEDNAVDAALLPSLTTEDLKDIGVTAVGHRRRMLEAIAALQAERDGAISPPSEATAGERRQVTVLFADLAGYTELSSRLDAEAMHALLGAFFDRVDRIVVEHGGHVDKHIGDCVMAVFGAPVSHGNDTARAASAALVIRDAVPGLSREVGQPMAVHVGVAGGQVVASSTGSAAHREYTVTGETVNLASRLTDAAGAGEILVADSVRRELAGRIEAEPLGDVAVKGLAVPVRVWRLAGLHAPAHEERPLVGRRGELRQLGAILAACRDGGQGQAVVIRGEAGLGKTRLVEEVQRIARDAGFACHAGLVLDFGAGTGRDAVRALVRSLLGLDVAATADKAGGAAARAVEHGLVAPDDVVFLNDLLDLPQPAGLRALYEAMDNTHRNRGKRRLVARLVERASRRQPLLLVVEDLHWADPLTLAHLARLAETAAACPIVLLLTTRIEGDPLDRAWRASIEGVALTTVDLGPLRAEEARLLVELTLSRQPRFAEQCIERAAGNPLFLEQLLRHAEESREPSAVPGSVQSLVQARLDQLEPIDKAALQAASVLGQRFDGKALEHVLGRADHSPERLVARLLLRPQQAGAFLFAHALVRDAVYDSLLKARRRELHRAAAAWYEGRDSALRAEHLDRAEAPEAAGAYLAAAREQAAQYRYETARRLVERGLELASEPGDAFALACLKGEILHDLGVMPQARQAYEAALEIARDDGQRCTALLGLAATLRMLDDFDGAIEALDRAQGLARRHGLGRAMSHAHHMRGNIYFPLGQIERCTAEHEAALRLAEAEDLPEEVARAWGGLGDAAYMQSRMRTAHEHFSRCVAISRDHGLGRVAVANLSMVAQCLFYLHRFDEAIEVARDAVAVGERTGHKRAMIVALNAIVDVAASRGLSPVAIAEIDRSLALAREIGARRFEAHGLRQHAAVLLAQGRKDDARTLLEQALQMARETGIRFVGPWILAMLAAVVEDEARRAALRAEAKALLAAGSPGHNYFWVYRAEIETALDAGDLDSAEEAAAALAEHTAAEPLPWSDFWIRAARALVGRAQGGRSAEVEMELRALLAEAERCGMLGPAQRLRAALASA